MKLSEWTIAFARETQAAILRAVAPLAGAISDVVTEVRAAKAAADRAALDSTACGALLAEYEKAWEARFTSLHAADAERWTGVAELQARVAALSDAEARAVVREAEARSSLADRFADLQRSLLQQVAAITPPKGDPGRDARMAAPVAFKEGEGYRFNDWVRFAGGLWHCHRDTDAAPDATKDCGWTLVIDGVAALFMELDACDVRAATLVTRLASGTEQRFDLYLPGMVGRGVWGDAPYEAGDVVSHAGSAWLAKRANRGAKPGVPDSADDWTLLVKRGKDGISQPPLRAFDFRGDYDADAIYQPQDMVRALGAIWCCTKPGTTEPPHPRSKAWMLFLSLAEAANAA